MLRPSRRTVREGGTRLAHVDGVSFLGHAGASYRLPSGRYRLTAYLR